VTKQSLLRDKHSLLRDKQSLLCDEQSLLCDEQTLLRGKTNIPFYEEALLRRGNTHKQSPLVDAGDVVLVPSGKSIRITPIGNFVI